MSFCSSSVYSGEVAEFRCSRGGKAAIGDSHPRMVFVSIRFASRGSKPVQAVFNVIIVRPSPCRDEQCTMIYRSAAEQRGLRVCVAARTPMKNSSTSNAYDNVETSQFGMRQQARNARTMSIKPARLAPGKPVSEPLRLLDHLIPLFRIHKAPTDTHIAIAVPNRARLVLLLALSRRRMHVDERGPARAARVLLHARAQLRVDARALARLEAFRRRRRGVGVGIGGGPLLPRDLVREALLPLRGRLRPQAAVGAARGRGRARELARLAELGGVEAAEDGARCWRDKHPLLVALRGLGLRRLLRNARYSLKCLLRAVSSFVGCGSYKDKGVSQVFF
ncbi:hypothetical protein GGX14DRAFT_658357 [Mycena pura]|uniref:Uncharacterized protein n=1 Tax=Mycena pura TaxID=153505 RepID=A0AAD7E1E8_9AGAR|nr:hypothetical protein GGX14DRAFT_658357 [Mycena pura]